MCFFFGLGCVGLVCCFAVILVGLAVHVGTRCSSRLMGYFGKKRGELGGGSKGAARLVSVGVGEKKRKHNKKWKEGRGVAHNGQARGEEVKKEEKGPSQAASMGLVKGGKGEGKGAAPLVKDRR